MSPSYRLRLAAGQVTSRPRRTTPSIRREIRRKYFRLRMKQMELALEYDVSQSTIARCLNEAYWK
jgi:DNA-binding transcriptional regulator LsrR (DeoR family)